ncbi:uncharacterized protein LOC112572611 [Pomacea canaliculata]|uniref:uncharacterized protein LOC112572611 n=1 Tax=Pomacea canaliculata TaxID=400727 RepID=UPI000D73A5C0|nr:uncharacterized protein LOC112572611 [Pomacea canaliculata]
MVAFTAYSVKLVVCEGVYTGSLKVVVTTDCYNQLLSLNKGSLSKETLTLVGGNGGATVTIKGGTLKGTSSGSGTTTITLPSDLSLTSCPGGSAGTLYSSNRTSTPAPARLSAMEEIQQACRYIPRT